MDPGFDSRRFLESIPTTPGVYRMLAGDGTILYVGKARDLRARLTSYFRGGGQSVKTRSLMQHSASIEVTVTHTESEALLLESNLIKNHRPRYNILLRDDKSYPYIHLSGNHPFPRLGFYRGSRREAGRFFGPYPSAAAVRESLALLQKIFPVRQCRDGFFRNRSRPCLQYQIKRCTGPCVGLVSEQDYARDVAEAVEFLEGRGDALVTDLVTRMEQAAGEKDYERAAVIRDRISSLRRIQERQYVSDTGAGNVDVVAAVVEHGRACVELVCVRNGQNLGSRHYFPAMGEEGSPAEVVEAFITQHYAGQPPPPEILVSHEPPDRELLVAALSERAGCRMAISHRLRGPRARWVRMAEVNAADALRRHLAGRASLRERYEALAEALGLDAVPERIECVDISHTGGEATVASCVAFDRDGPLKSDYRRYNIETASSGDDYAAIAEVVSRRFRRVKDGEGRCPDLMFIDGGRGQLAAAETAVEELQVDDVRLVAVAKGPQRRPGLEQLFLSGRKAPLILPADSPALHLVQQIRDEAHRFAITGHRARRGRTRTASALEQIAGVGPRRRQALLKHLGGIQEVRRAGVEDLARVPGISPELARRIYDELNR